jgi:multidrug efflux pump subunit AcrB
VCSGTAIGASLFARVLLAGFIPDKNQGIFGINLQLPPGASLERKNVVLNMVEDIIIKTDGLDSCQTVCGYGVVTSTYQPNYGTIFVRMKPWDERKTAALHVNSIMGALRSQVAAIPEAVTVASEQGMPAVHGAPCDWRREPFHAPRMVR